MTIQLEVANSQVGHSFFEVGASLVVDSSFLSKHLPSITPSEGTDMVRFFEKKTYRVFLREENLEEVADFCWAVFDECARREKRDVSWITGPNGSRLAAGRSFHMSREPKELPPFLPIVVSDSSVCFGCGKIHDEPIGHRLQIGPYDVPCCPGRSNGFKRSCVLEAMGNLRCCVACGRLHQHKLGQVCSYCVSLLRDGERAVASIGKTEVVDMSFAYGSRMKSDTRRLFVDTMVSMGGKSDLEGKKISVNESAAPLVNALLETIVSSLESEYLSGLERGKSLLLGLANGTVSSSDFDQVGRK